MIVSAPDGSGDYVSTFAGLRQVVFLLSNICRHLSQVILITMSLNEYDSIASGLSAGKYHPRISSDAFALLPWRSALTTGSLTDLVNQRKELHYLKVGHRIKIWMMQVLTFSRVTQLKSPRLKDRQNSSKPLKTFWIRRKTSGRHKP